MPRQRRGGPARAPARPAAAPARPSGPPQQQRAMTTTAAPGKAQAPMQQQQQQGGSGLFGQMASTAAGVAVGSSIGHAIGGFFGGGSSQAAQADQSQAVANPQESAGYQSNSWGPRSCEPDAKQFTKCLDENQGNMQICGWYLEQLKACQAASAQFGSQS